jgi:hypothetical protein
MGLTLIIVGLVISYFCWIQKREIDYSKKKNYDNTMGTGTLTDKRIEIQTKLLNHEKLTLSENLNWYSYKIMYGALKCGFYGGFILSFIGLALFISVIFHFTFR